MIKKPIIRKPSEKKEGWALLKWAVIVIICVSGAMFILNTLVPDEKMISESKCSQMENDAENTLAAISSYFANPERTTLPTVDQLIKEEDLWTTYPVKLEGDPEEDIIVTVINNGDNQCPKGKKYVVVMGGGEGVWKK